MTRTMKLYKNETDKHHYIEIDVVEGSTARQVFIDHPNAKCAVLCDEDGTKLHAFFRDWFDL